MLLIKVKLHKETINTKEFLIYSLPRTLRRLDPDSPTSFRIKRTTPGAITTFQHLISVSLAVLFVQETYIL